MGLIALKEYGEVKEVRSSIIKVTGFSSCMVGQLVKFSDESSGLIIGFNQEHALVLLLRETRKIKRGDEAFTYVNEEFKIGVGEGYLGRIVNALGKPCDGGDLPKDVEYYSLFREAPSILERIPIEEVFETGIKIIDMCIPLGCGQRELIIGDRVTGKTSLATDIILHQKNKDVVCIYCFLSKTESELWRVVELFREKGVFDYTIVVCASAAATVGEQYLAPYVAATLGEYFMYKGRKVLVVFDDLTKHAWIYRQISLLLERASGRDAYPGDIFYLHSQLMERAAKLSPSKKGGSMTFLPIAETLGGDVTGYISSNLIAMTDGQIYLSTPLFQQGFKPAIDLELSVSRIGSKVQWPGIKELSKGLRLEYLRQRKIEQISRMRIHFGEDMETRLKKGYLLRELFNQQVNEPVPLNQQLVLFYIYREGFWDDLSLPRVREAKKEIFSFINQHAPELMGEIEKHKELTKAIKEKLDSLIKTYSRDKI